MRKWLLVGLGLAVVAVVAGVALDPTRAVLGRLRGETFYRGRPVSFAWVWRKAA